MATATKTDIKRLQAKIKAKQAEITKLIKEEGDARRRWNKGHRAFKSNVKKFAVTDAKHRGTKKDTKLRDEILNWIDDPDVRHTRRRDSSREKMATAQAELNELTTQLAVASAEIASRERAIDEIVSTVFSLNESAVQASRKREDYVTRHVFTRLVGPDGKLNTQVTFTSADGLRRVVAMVNHITLIQGDNAQRAKGLVSQFFDRFQGQKALDEAVRPLYELTRQLLVEKTQFKVGPDLYRFLSMELDATVFPELAEAQELLRASIRSETTNSYIRIFERESRSGKWTPVRQS